MIARKFVYGGVIVMVVTGSALAVNAQSNTTSPHPSGFISTLSQLGQRFEGIFGHGLLAAAATPQPTGQPTTAPTAAPTVQPTAVPQTAYLGIRVEDTAKGITVRDVIDGSAAAAGGLKADDIIQKANGATVKNVMAFAQEVLKMKPDDTLKLDVMRGDKATALTVKVGSEDQSKAFVMPANVPYEGLNYDAKNKSWHVFQLSERSLMYSAGLRMNDEITAFDDKPVAPADFQAYRDALKTDANIKLTVQTSGKERTITVPGGALKNLAAFDYNDNGLLLHALSTGNSAGPDLESLSHITPVNAIAYDGKAWQIYSLVDGSALQSSGLQMNDQITMFNGKAYDPDAMRKWLGTMSDTTDVKLTVMRGGKSQSISVPAGDLSNLYLLGDKSGALFFGLPENGFKPNLGAEAIALTDDIAKQHQLKQTTGALVTNIQPNSVAATAGLQTNDVITAVSSQKIDAQHELNSLIAALKPGEALTLEVARGDKIMQLKATLPQPDVTGELPTLIKTL